MKKTKRILTFITVAYILLTVPVMFVFTKSEYVRFIAIQMVTNWKGKINGLSDAYIGDSITAGGRSWNAPFDAINLAGDGYTTWQIENQIGRAEKYDPDNLLILAGTNDILSRRIFDLDQFERDYVNLLDRALETGKQVFVTQIPYTAGEERIQTISDANEVIIRLAGARDLTTIDLNSTVAPNGILLPEFTTDGVHLSSRAYSIWREKILDAKKQKAEQSSGGNG
ncbi:MAG: GDSL-type esterase/lipase family protein [Verrucomicrobiota bacterium]